MSKTTLSPRELTIHNQFTRYGRNAKEWLRKCAVLLPKIQEYEIWKKRRCHSIYEYAAKVAGMNHDQTCEALRVMNHIKDKPELVAMAERKGINAVRAVATIATKETAKLWANRIEISSVNTVKMLVREERQSRNVPTSQPGKMQKGVQQGDANIEDSGIEEGMMEVVSLKLPTELARKIDRIRKRADFEQLLGQFLAGVEQQEKAEKPEAVETDSRHIPSEIERFSRQRTGEKCAFPGCDKPIHQLHHTQRWALHHIHDPDRLWGLCTAHNDIAHLGLIENEEGRPETWRLRETADWMSDKWIVDQRVAMFRVQSE